MPTKSKWLHTFIEFLIENLTILLATSEIVERYRRLNSIEKSVSRSLAFLENRFMERPSAMAFFTKHPSLDAYVQGATEIDLMG